MNRDKQIDEMAKVIENGINICAKKPCEDCDFCGADDCMCQNLVIAKELHTAGYRKTSEVAREIFEEIDDILRKDASDYDDLMDSEIVPEIYAEYLACSNYIDGIRQIFAELKKKYTEGEG